MKKISRIFGFAATLAACSCSADWSAEELELIGGDAQTMRVLTVDNEAEEAILRQRCKELSASMVESDTYKALAEKMLATVTSPEQDGVGIAGPQVGISRRVVAVLRYDKEGTPFEVYPNIRITSFNGATELGPEGCLSVPGKRGNVERYQDIDIEYTDPVTLKKVKENVKGYTAVIFQHECDHLDGIIYTDKMTDNMDWFNTAKGEKVGFNCLTHGSFSMTFGGKWFYIDPVGKGVSNAPDFTQLPKADYIFITHEHGDHLDAEAIAQIYQEGCTIIANPNSAKALEGTYNVITLTNGQSADLGNGCSVDAVPAYNYSEGKLNFHPAHRDNGYIIDLDGFRVYAAGDTEDIPEMKDVHDIDVAFLPCNLPYTMTPEQCSAAARMFMPEVLFPYHYGQTEISRVVDLLSDTDIKVLIRQYQ